MQPAQVHLCNITYNSAGLFFFSFIWKERYALGPLEFLFPSSATLPVHQSDS